MSSRLGFIKRLGVSAIAGPLAAIASRIPAPMVQGQAIQMQTATLGRLGPATYVDLKIATDEGAHALETLK